MRSRIAYILSVVVLLYTSFFFYPKWTHEDVERVIEYDVTSYYWYLPAAFIYDDIEGDKPLPPNAVNDHKRAKSQLVHDVESNHYIPNYSIGMAVMYLPFFTIAHILSVPLGYAANGFSTPYQLALQLGSVFMALLGMWYYRKLLLRLYSDKVTAVMLLLLVVGTNYLNYTAIDGAQTHNWLFTLYALLLLNTDNFYKTPKRKYSYRIGVLLGLMILIRPTEIIAILIPILWGVESPSIKAARERLHFFARHKKHLIITTVVILLLGSIQLAYWQYTTGKLLVYTYEEKGFSWLAQHVYNYVFSARSGWLSYTPMLALSFVGIIPFLKFGKNKIAVLLIFILSFYITTAWDIWWYGGSGGRAMIQVYPVILLPFASLLSYAFEKATMWVLLPFLLLFSYINIWFTYQAHTKDGLYDATGGMTSMYYWHVIGRYNVPKHTKIYKDIDEYFDGIPKNLTLIHTNDFEQDTLENNTHVIDGERSLYIDSNRKYAAQTAISYTNTGADWVRAQLIAKPIFTEWEAWKMIQFTIRFSKNENQIIKSKMIRLNRYTEAQEISTIHFDVKIPKDEFDTIEVLLWNPCSIVPVIVDNIKVYTFEV
ncbi:MAG: hypothetical protein R2800_13025 [Flavipsychrobacter sp.]